MLEQKSVAELKRLFQLLKRDDKTFDLLIEMFKPHIATKGKSIVTDESNMKDPIAYTQGLLDFKAEMDEVVEEAFENMYLFQKARDFAFSLMMGQQVFTPTYLASYADKELGDMKTGLRDPQNGDANKILDTIINLFRCLTSRDAFLAKA